EHAARAFALAVMMASTSILAASAQIMPGGQTTAQAGQMTQARVHIENRGRAEALPVEVSAVTLDAPLRVQVINGDPSMRVNPVMVAETRKVWEYETVMIPATGAGNAIALLNNQGANGWETTGIALNAPDGLLLVLKRPR